MAATELKEANKNNKRIQRNRIIHEELGTMNFPDGSVENVALEIQCYTQESTDKEANVTAYKEVYALLYINSGREHIILDTTDYPAVRKAYNCCLSLFLFGQNLGFEKGFSCASSL